MSDTWSTDVLASDSEPPELENQLDRLEEIAEEMVRQNMLGVHMSEVSSQQYTCTFTVLSLIERVAVDVRGDGERRVVDGRAG